MQIIVISHPEFLPDEAQLITALFEAGLQRFHLRKPDATEEEVEALLLKIPQQYYPHIVVHNHHALALRYPLRGVHLNARHPQVPKGYQGGVSCSCHSLEEAARWKPTMDYVFLSPIFDSISKEGYHSAYTDDSLTQAAAKGIIDQKVIALGGITPQRIPYLHSKGFGGAAVLGTIWHAPTAEAVVQSFLLFSSTR